MKWNFTPFDAAADDEAGGFSPVTRGFQDNERADGPPEV
jgi:hypothetical protein